MLNKQSQGRKKQNWVTYQHFLFPVVFSTLPKLRFCLSTGTQWSLSDWSLDFIVCIHLIVVRNLAHSRNPQAQARSSAVCPFLLHKLNLRQKLSYLKIDNRLAFFKNVSFPKGALGSYKCWFQNRRSKGIRNAHIPAIAS